MTTTMGRRVEMQVRRDTKAQEVLLIGLANEYYGYVTTHEEYQEQEYEGASTLFGPESGACYLNLLRQASMLPPSTGTRTVPDATFSPGSPPFLAAHFGPTFWGENPEFADEELTVPFMREAFVEGGRFARLEWRGYEDREVVLLEFRNGSWGIEEFDDDGHLLTLITSGRTDPPTWHTVWTPDSGHDCSTPHVIKVVSDSGATCSVQFTLERLATGQVEIPMPQSACPL
jgi:hypothetical protein